MSDFEIALAHYRQQFPTIEKLGPSANLWQAEYDRLVKAGLSAKLILQSSSETGSATAQRNFDQKTLLSALLTVRGELDSDFATLVFTPSKVKPMKRAGFLVVVD